MTSAISLTSLRAAVAEMGTCVTLSPDEPGLAALAGGWANVLLTDGFAFKTATTSGVNDPSRPLQVAGVANVFDVPAPLAVTLYRPTDVNDDSKPECMIEWSQPVASWSPADSYLYPAATDPADTPFQTILRSVAVQNARLFYSSADLALRAPAAAACGPLPSWLNGWKPRDGLTAIGTLQLPGQISGVLEALIGGPLGPLAVTANMRVTLGFLMITLHHTCDGADRTLAPFGAGGPTASLSAIDLAFPIDDTSSMPPSAMLTFALADNGAEADLTVTIDLFRQTASLDLQGVPGKEPSLAWFAHTIGITAPDLPFDLGNLILARLAGTFDLAQKKLTACEAAIGTDKPLTVLDGHLCFSPEVIIAHDPAATPALDVCLVGVWERGGSKLDTVIDPSDGGVALTLQRGSTVDLDSLLGKDFLPPWLTTDLVILDFDLIGNVKSGGFTVELETDGMINLSIEGQTFGVGDVGIVAQYADKAFEVTARGTLEICNYLVGLSLNVGPTTTVSFTLPQIDLSDLAEVFLQKIGKPEDLGSFALEDVDVSLTHPGGQFSLSGGITDHIPLGESVSWRLESATFAASRDAQGLHASIAGTIALAGQPINLTGQYLGSGLGWLLTGGVTQSKPIPLGGLVSELAQKLGAAVPAELVDAIGSIEIDALNVAANTHDKSFQFLADVTTKGTVPLGDRSYQLDLKAYVSSTVDASGKRSFAGHLEGDLTIGKAVFVVVFDFGAGATAFKASWQDSDGSTLSFTDIARALHIPADVSVPKELDLGLKAAAFEYRSTNSTFVLSAESTSFGDAFFTAGKDQHGRFGFVFGVDLPPGMKPSSLPGIGRDLKPADFLTVRQGAIVIASGDFPSYQLPALPALPPASTNLTPWTARLTSGRSIRPVATGATLQLTSGLSIAAIVDLGSAHDVRAQNLRDITRSNELMLQASIGSGGLKLIGLLAGNVAVQGGNSRGGRSRVSLAQPMVQINCGPEITFQLSGGVDFTIQGTPVVATARIMINETEAQVAFEMAGQQKPLPAPPGIKGLHIDSFGIVMGLYFAPPGLDLGFTGNFTIGEVQTLRNDSFGMVLEVLEEAANVLYMAFYVDQLELGEVLTLFTDRNEPSLIQNLEFIRASDLSFHWCDDVVTLPDGSVVPPGFGFSASLDVLGMGAHAELEVGITEGIHGRAEIAPFNLKNVLNVAGSSPGMTRTYQEINGTWQQVDNAAIKRTLPAPPTRREIIVAPGGPFLEFNCKAAPFVQGGLTVSLFEAHADVRANVDQSGFAFGLDFDVGNIEKFTLTCALKDKDNFSGSAGVKIGVDTQVGPIHVAGHDVGHLHLVTRVDGNLAVTLDPQRFSLSLDGSFDFEGLSFTIPHLGLDVAPAKLAELPPKLVDLLSHQADQIFQPLFADGARWAGMVKKGIVTGAGDVATTLKDAYHMSDKDAQQAMQKAGYDANVAAKAIDGAYGKVASGVTNAANDVAHEASKDADTVKDTGEHVVHDVGNDLKHWFHI